jgi:hypothetical protein
MYVLWETADLKSVGLKLSKAMASGRLEIEHNGERVRYRSLREMRIISNDIQEELRTRGELKRDGEEQRAAPTRVLYPYSTGNP